MHGHVQEAGEIGERTAHAEREHDDAHVLDRRIGEHALDVAPSVKHERRENDGDESHCHHQRARCERSRVHRQQHLESQQRVKCDVEQEPRKHRRNRRRTFGMRIGQPGVQRRQPHLGAIAEQQKDECDVQEFGAEAAGPLNQRRPHHGVGSLADHRSRRHVDENRSEQGESDPDTAKNEIFPRRFERLMGAIDADHEHGGERGKLDRHPHQTDVICGEPEVHRKHQGLIHGVVKAQMIGREPADFQFVSDVAGAEYAGREGDEGRQHDESVVQIVDEKVISWRRPIEQEQYSSDQSDEGGQHIEASRNPIAGQQRQHRRSHRGNNQHGRQRLERKLDE